MDFGEALRRLREGSKVAREGWNGKGMWLWLVDDDVVDRRGIIEAGPSFERSHKLLPFLVMKTVSGDLVPWLASQTDLLAFDWTEVR